jgi:multicomponent K+:H+ antiporter subunit F
MLANATVIAMTMIAIAMALNVWRLILGPSILDRVLALDTLYLNSIALLVLLGIYRGTQIFLDFALMIAVFGFISTVAMAKYAARGGAVDRFNRPAASAGFLLAFACARANRHARDRQHFSRVADLL